MGGREERLCDPRAGAGWVGGKGTMRQGAMVQRGHRDGRGPGAEERGGQQPWVQSTHGSPGGTGSGNGVGP